MATAFDMAAAAYDQNFTHSIIGRYQRAQVRRHLTDALSKSEIKSVLEINCGTGEDAAWLASKQLEVTATDISSEMISKAREKTDAATFLVADINDIPAKFAGHQFNLIFSNFGGLNCLNPEQLAAFFNNSADILSENGKLVLVLMPKDTLWEKLYFLTKSDFANASRRKKGNALAYVDGDFVDTHYYNPKLLIDLAKPFFYVTKVAPIGLFVPPSYLEPQLAKRPRLAAALNRLDRIINWPFLAKYADHFIITLEKR